MMIKMRKKKHIAILAAFIMTFSITNGIAKRDFQVNAESNTISSPRISEDGIVTWDKVQFGRYDQTASFEEQSIKWRILSIDDDGNALLLSDKVLDSLYYENDPYTEKDGEIYTKEIAWGNCSLHDWLNGEFYESAFTKEEQADIQVMQISDKELDIEEGVLQSIDTTDKVTLLSYNDILNEEYGFSSNNDEDDEAKTAVISDYALMNGENRSNNPYFYDKCGEWWLRSSVLENDDGYEDRYASKVYWMGKVSCVPLDLRMGVRPVIKVNLESDYIEDAGRINAWGEVSDGDADYYSNPQMIDDVMVWDCVCFGTYKQEAEFENEPIEWRVLSVEGDEALLLSEKALEGKEYNTKGFVKVEDEEGTIKDYRGTWEASTLRKWLNEEFFVTAFNEAERASIKDSTVENKETAPNGTSGAGTTTDKVYLLSEGDVTNNIYGFNKNLTATGETRKALTTDYASITGLGYIQKGSEEWWLRDSDKIVGVDGDIIETYEYYWGKDKEVTVRPAILVSISSANLVSSGTISAELGDNSSSVQENSASDSDVSKGDVISGNNTGVDNNTNVPKKIEENINVLKPVEESNNVQQYTAIGTVYTDESGKYKVKVTSNSTDNLTADYVGTSNKKAKNITIPDNVIIDGISYNITKIADNAFKNNKKITKITVGKNISIIGKNAFANCKNLKTVTIKSSTIKSIGKNAFKNINKRANIKVPKKQYKKYKKLITAKKTGYKKSMKINKK